MAFDLGGLGAKFQQNKKVLIPAAIAGGALGLYVLSQRKGGSGGAPIGTDAGQQPPATGSGTDWGQAISQLQDALTKSNVENADAIAALVEGQQGYQGGIAAAFADITRQVNDALAAAQRQTQEAINNIPQAGQAPLPSLGYGGGLNGLESLFQQTPMFNPADYITRVQQTASEPVKNVSMPSSAGIINQLKNLTNTRVVSAPAKSVAPKVNPVNYAQQLANTFGRSVQQTVQRSSQPLAGLGSIPTGLNAQFAAGFNKLSSGGVKTSTSGYSPARSVNSISRSISSGAGKAGVRSPFLK